MLAINNPVEQWNSLVCAGHPISGTPDRPIQGTPFAQPFTKVRLLLYAMRTYGARGDAPPPAAARGQGRGLLGGPAPEQAQPPRPRPVAAPAPGTRPPRLPPSHSSCSRSCEQPSADPKRAASAFRSPSVGANSPHILSAPRTQLGQPIQGDQGQEITGK